MYYIYIYLMSLKQNANPLAYRSKLDALAQLC